MSFKTLTRQESLDRTYTYHKPTPDQVERYTAIRTAGRHLADVVVLSTPPSREQSVALTNIQQAIMWANAAIAITEQESD